MTGMQWLIWSLAAAGKFFEGFVVFMTGVALPLLSSEFNIGAAEHGVIGAASLFGILVGAVGLGGLSDRFGRKPMFVAEMIIFVAFLVLLCFCTNYIELVICLLGLGLSLGCDYPTAHMIISESIPSTSRGKLVLGAFAFQAVGALGGTAVGYLVLSTLPEISAWRWMYASAIIPAVLVTIGRFYIVESANWLSRARRNREGRARGEQAAGAQAAISLGDQARARDAQAAAKASRNRAMRRCSTAPIGARRSWPRFPGSCRTSEPMASASSRRPSWPPRSARNSDHARSIADLICRTSSPPRARR